MKTLKYKLPQKTATVSVTSKIKDPSLILFAHSLISYHIKNSEKIRTFHLVYSYIHPIFAAHLRGILNKTVS